MYPISNIIKTTLNMSKFTSLVFDSEYVSHLAPELNLETCIISATTATTAKILKKLRIYLQIFFGAPPKTPILDIPEENLLGDKDIILFCQTPDKQIMGCIRYHYIGIFLNSNKEMYSIDCFCIHPSCRGKGLADYLLTTLHKYVNRHKISYSLFLKEGRALNIILPPMYSAKYMYRELQQNVTGHIIDLTISQAYSLLDIFLEISPDVIIIANKESGNQMWKLYKKSKYYILACFQNTYQYFENNRKNNKIGWCTGWMESPNITNEIREEAAIELADSMYQEYQYMWLNSAWIGKNYGAWKEDGSFHWYAYQWITNLSIKTSYCILN